MALSISRQHASVFAEDKMIKQKETEQNHDRSYNPKRPGDFSKFERGLDFVISGVSHVDIVQTDYWFSW